MAQLIQKTDEYKKNLETMKRMEQKLNELHTNYESPDGEGLIYSQINLDIEVTLIRGMEDILNLIKRINEQVDAIDKLTDQQQADLATKIAQNFNE